MDYYSIVHTLSMKNRMSGGAIYDRYGGDPEDEIEDEIEDREEPEYIGIDQFIENYKKSLDKRGGGIIRVYDVQWDDDDKAGELITGAADLFPAKMEFDDFIVENRLDNDGPYEGACEDADEAIDLIVDRSGGALENNVEIDLDEFEQDNPSDNDNEYIQDSYFDDENSENNYGDEKLFELDDILAEYNRKFADLDNEEVLI